MPLEDKEAHLIWTREARERLSRLPYFLQEMIRRRVERHAREAGLEIITLELMEEIRKKSFGNVIPLFKDGRFRRLSDQ